MRILFPALFCSLLCAAPASAQSSIAGASGEAPALASAEAPLAPIRPIRSQTPVATARSKTIEIGLGYSYLTQLGNQSQRLNLRGADATFTIGFSRLGITADVGYARASNVL